MKCLLSILLIALLAVACTAAPIATPTPTPSPTLAPLSSPTPTPTPTATPIPTQPPPQRQAQEYLRSAQTYFDQKLWDNAIAECTKAIQLDPGLAAAYNARGVAYSWKEQYDEAIADAAKALELDPQKSLYRTNLAVVYTSRANARYSDGKYKLAIEDYTSALKIDPNYASAYRWRAEAYRESGLVAQAQADYSSLIRLEPAGAQAYYDRGVTFKMLGQKAEAVSDFEKFITLSKDTAMIERAQRRIEDLRTPEALGQERSFWVYDFQEKSHYQVRATLQRVGVYCYLYVDKAKTFYSWTMDDIVREFDQTIYPKVTATFGREPKPGIDGEARITILITDLHGEVGGYFAPNNEYLADTQQFSNEREMVYLRYDPAGAGNKRYEMAIYGSLAHELQHMISWNYDRDEERWVNEGCSELAEFICGYVPGFIRGGVANAFLGSPDKELVRWAGQESDYGAVFLWTLYLWEKYGGDDTIRSLVAEKENGIKGVNKVLEAKGYRQRFEDVFDRWTVANLLDDTTIGPEPHHYGYNSISLVEPEALVGSVNISNFPRASPCASHRSYPVQQKGTVNAWAADYVQFGSTSPGTLRLNFKGGDGAIFSVNVIESSSLDFAKGTNSVEKIALDSGQSGSLEIPGFGTKWKNVVLAISARPSGGAGPYSYSYEALLRR